MPTQTPYLSCRKDYPAVIDQAGTNQLSPQRDERARPLDRLAGLRPWTWSVHLAR